MGDLHFVNSPELCIKRFEDKCFDAQTGDLQSEKHQERVKDMLQRLIELTSRLEAPLDAAASGGYTSTSLISAGRDSDTRESHDGIRDRMAASLNSALATGELAK